MLSPPSAGACRRGQSWRVLVVSEARVPVVSRVCGASVGHLCCISEELLESEKDGGAGLQLVVKAALGSEGMLVESEREMCLVMADTAEGEEMPPVVLVKDGEKCDNRFPDGGVEVWTRAQFVQAVSRAGFEGQPYFYT